MEIEMRRLLAIGSAILMTTLVVSCSRKPEATAPRVSAATDVKIERVTAAAVDDLYEATGSVRSRTTSVVSSRIMGSVIAIHVREGDRVRAGQTLLEIDNRDAAAQVQKSQAGAREANEALEEIDRNIQAGKAGKSAAEANRTLAASTFHRYQALFDRHSASPQEFDEVQTKLRVAEAEAERATRLLSSLEARRNQVLARIDQAKADVSSAQFSESYAKIASPISGIITAKQVDAGAMATPGAPLLTVEDDSHYRLEAAVEESQIGNIHHGDHARVQIDALGDAELDGVVAEIVPSADLSSRSHIVKLDLLQTNGLRSGSYGKARFVIGQKQAITIPRRAITERGQLVSVFVVGESGIAHLRLIKTGKGYGDRIEVLTGLTDGERIVVDRVESLSDGARVE
jgi:multidrug efflux pump subunit AcrA (membrane-fusion protein)